VLTAKVRKLTGAAIGGSKTVRIIRTEGVYFDAMQLQYDDCSTLS
jgi:hypothetical protein